MINGFTLCDANNAPVPSADILRGVQTAWSFVPNLHRVLAQSPAALEAYSTLWKIAEKASFTPQGRNIVYGAGGVRERRPIADAKLEALRQFAAKVTRQRGVVRQADVAAFRPAGYDSQSVLDVLVLAATEFVSNYTNHLAETPNDSFMKGTEWNEPGRLKPAA